MQTWLLPVWIWPWSTLIKNEEQWAKYKNVYERSDDWDLQYVTALIRDNEGWILVGYNKKHNSWQIPSGKVDKWESLYDTLCREMDEELWVSVHEATILWTSKKIFFAMSREGHFYETTIQGTFASKEKETMEEFKRMHFIKTQTPLWRWLTDWQNELTNPEELLINRHMFAELRQMTTYPERKTLMKNPVHIPDAIDTNRQYIQYRNTETKSLHIDLYEKSFFAS